MHTRSGFHMIWSLRGRWRSSRGWNRVGRRGWSGCVNLGTTATSDHILDRKRRISVGAGVIQSGLITGHNMILGFLAFGRRHTGLIVTNFLLLRRLSARLLLLMFLLVSAISSGCSCGGGSGEFGSGHSMRPHYLLLESSPSSKVAAIVEHVVALRV